MRVLSVIVLVLASCGDPSSPPAPSPAAPPAIDGPLRTGIVEGIVRVDSDDIAPLTGSVLGYEKFCGPGPVDTGLYKVDAATKGLAGAFVEADGRCAEFRPEGVPVMDQKSCLFTPVLLVAAPGQVIFKNSDGMAHNVTIQGLLNPRVSEGFPGGEAISKSLPFEEKVAVRCTIHPWMKAWVRVYDHPYFAVTRPDGTFDLKQLPPGAYTIEAWHEKLGTQTQTVTIAAKQTSDVAFTFKI